MQFFKNDLSLSLGCTKVYIDVYKQWSKVTMHEKWYFLPVPRFYQLQPFGLNCFDIYNILKIKKKLLFDLLVNFKQSHCSHSCIFNKLVTMFSNNQSPCLFYI